MMSWKRNGGRMIFLTAMSVLIRAASTQYQTASFQNQLPTQRPITGDLYPAAPLHYVNIGPQLAGDYKFGYDTGKGPMGQSFREETRLADGTVKGSYGVIDERGHKRVVHYSAGKGGFAAEEDTYTPDSQLAALQRQPKLITQQNLYTLPQQFPVFKPSSYLQSRTTMPLYVPSAPAQPEEVENRLPLPLNQKANQISRPIYRLPNPFSTLNADVPLYRTSVPAQASKASVPEFQSFQGPLYKTTATTSPPTQTPITSAPAQRQNKGSATAAQSSEASQEEIKNAGSLHEIYKAQIRRKVTKKPSLPLKIQRVQKKKTPTEDQSYDPKIEDDYYDSSPAFVDFERLSYNIGTDKNSVSL